VQWQEHLGEATHVYLESGNAAAGAAISTDESWMIKVLGHATNQPGDRIQVALSPSSIHVFDDQGLALERSVSDDELKASNHSK
jgi:multiple sugar transport system ATP-binding protein